MQGPRLKRSEGVDGPSWGAGEGAAAGEGRRPKERTGCRRRSKRCCCCCCCHGDEAVGRNAKHADDERRESGWQRRSSSSLLARDSSIAERNRKPAEPLLPWTPFWVNVCRTVNPTGEGAEDILIATKNHILLVVSRF